METASYLHYIASYIFHCPDKGAINVTASIFASKFVRGISLFTERQKLQYNNTPLNRLY